MNKRLFCILFLSAMLLFSAGCSQPISFDPQSIYNEAENQFMWPGLRYGMTMEEVEEALDIQFSDLPVGILPELKEQEDYVPFDYRHNYNYDFATFLAYRNGSAVRFNWNGYIGHLSVSFHSGHYFGAMLSFGSVADFIDPDMRFAGDGMRIDSRRLYSQLRDALSKLYGPPVDNVFSYAEVDEYESYWRMPLNNSEKGYTEILLSQEDVPSGTELYIDVYTNVDIWKL